MSQLPLYLMHERHRALTVAVAGSYQEAAAVCFNRHHQSPVEITLSDNGVESQTEVHWALPILGRCTHGRIPPTRPKLVRTAASSPASRLFAACSQFDGPRREREPTTTLDQRAQGYRTWKTVFGWRFPGLIKAIIVKSRSVSR